MEASAEEPTFFGDVLQVLGPRLEDVIPGVASSGGGGGQEQEEVGIKVLVKCSSRRVELERASTGLQPFI